MQIKSIFSGVIIAGAVLSASSLYAGTIKVLWTSGTDAYDASMQKVADAAPGFDTAGDGSLTWDVTFWDGDHDPGFADFDVLVVGSTCDVAGDEICGRSPGFYGNGVSSAGVLTFGDEIADARGNRTFLSGQDADYHQLNNVKDRLDGPMGFMINAVNWAASGTDLGIVSMTDRITTGPTGWWTHEDSFLKDEIPAADVFAFNSETVNIGAGQEGFPVNEGLTSAGLSNWSTSSHACFNEVDGYTRINFAPHSGGLCGVTIVTAGEEDGDTDGGDTPSAVPLPAGGWLLVGGLGALGALRRRRKA